MGFMRVGIKNLDNKMYYVQPTPEDTVSTLKELVHIETGVAPAQQRLAFNGMTMVPDTKKLREFGVDDGHVILLLCRMVGGACCLGVGFNFASMKSGSKLGFSQNAPKYRMIGGGFNLEGRCQNKQCKAFKQLAWSNIGYSRSEKEVTSLFDTAGFNIGILMNRTPCPLCKHIMDPKAIVSCGFYRCKYSYEGYQEGSTDVIKGSGEATDYDQFEYHNGLMHGKTWTSLIIVVDRV